jgi:penicillin G amidase
LHVNIGIRRRSVYYLMTLIAYSARMRCALWLLIITAAHGETIQVTGLKHRVEILIDHWGVPHIYAKDFDDAFFAQGFNVARDRLFQIDLWHRRGLGQLSEVFGPGYVEQDRAARLFLFRGDIEREWSSYGPDARRIATAFVRGINAYIDELNASPNRLPIEFKAMGYKPGRWVPADVVRIRSHGLTGNLRSEVARANVICKAGVEDGPKHDQFRVGLQPKWDVRVPDGLDPCLPPNVLTTFALATRAVPFHTGQAVADGSNNWAIAPSKSATGRAVLASDPHRAYSTPSLRYIAHVSAPGLNIIGAGEPSLPGISIGHNGTIAFGLTRFYIDQEDLYVYELNPADTRQYRYGKGWEPMHVVREEIAVKGSSTVGADLMFTRHGPVVYSDGRRAYAVRSAWFEAGTAAYFGSAKYMMAKNGGDFRSGIAVSRAPGLNYVYADVKGNIGWIAGGLAPIRPNWDGLMPVPGDGRYEWAGFWKPEELPSTINPAMGYISTSNEMNLPPEYGHRKFGFEWANPSRHLRIQAVLGRRSKVTLEDSMTLQNDITSLPALRLLALLAPLKSNDPTTVAALELLRGWNGVETTDSAQAALMEIWISRRLGTRFLNAMLSASSADVIGSPDIAVMLDVLESGGVPGQDALLLGTLAAAYNDVAQLLGSDPKKWQWGKLHHSLPAHPLLEAVGTALRSKLQVGPFPKAGGPFTPNMSDYRIPDFRQTNGPSFRIVMDVGNWNNSRAVNYPGQSGNPDDPHFRDLAPLWLDGQYFPLLYTRAAVKKAVEREIVLTPYR